MTPGRRSRLPVHLPHPLPRVPHSEARRGGVLLLTLVCMAVATTIAATMLGATLVARRALRTERDLRQVECLLAAAADVARVRHATGLSLDHSILLEPSAVSGIGSARITLTAGSSDAGSQAIRLAVEYPLEGPVTIRRSRTIHHPSVPSRAPEEIRP